MKVLIYVIIINLVLGVALLSSGCAKTERDLDLLADEVAEKYCSSDIRVAEKALRDFRQVLKKNISKRSDSAGDFTLLYLTCARLSLLLKYRGEEDDARHLMNEAKEAAVRAAEMENASIPNDARIVQMIERLDSHLDIKWKQTASPSQP